MQGNDSIVSSRPDDEDHREVKMAENQGFVGFCIRKYTIGQGNLTKF